jgi:hypothetical protein
MGNRAQLAFGTCCEFEANSCVPVTWLALFASSEFSVERRVEELVPPAQKPTERPSPGLFQRLLIALRSTFRRDLTETSGDETQSQALREPEEYDVAIYRTSQTQALQRVESVISKLQGHTPVWAFLRLLEILRDELVRCPQEIIELDLTQFWAIDQVFEQRVAQAPDDFTRLLQGLTGEEGQDLVALDRLVSLYDRAQISSIADLNPKDRMFVLIGTYWGDPKREAMYSPEHFNEAYWVANEAD